MKSGQDAIMQFKDGFVTNLTGIVAHKKEIFQSKYLKSILVGIFAMIVLACIIAFPFYGFLYSFEKAASFFSNKLAGEIKDVRINMAFYNVILETAWYIPMLLLTVSRLLHLFSTEPFEIELKHKEPTFGRELYKAKRKQSTGSTVLRISEHIAKALLLSMTLCLVRFIPTVRYGVAALTILYLGYKKYSEGDMYHLNSIRLTLLAFAVSMFFSNYLTEGLLYFAKFYLTTKSMSRFYLSEYFHKVTLEMEQKDEANNRWFLFGFGTAIVMCYSVPFLGLVLFPAFYASAADLLVMMLKTNGLTFHAQR